MKRYILILSLSLMAVISATAASPVHWSHEVRMSSDTEGAVVITASIDKGWHLYSTNLPDGGPNPTTFTFEDQPGLTWVGGVSASHQPADMVDMVFHLKLPCWVGEVTFTQDFKIDGAIAPGAISCSIRYQACNDASCVPPSTESFTFKLPEKALTAHVDSAAAQSSQEIPAIIQKTVEGSTTITPSAPANVPQAQRKIPDPWIYIFVWGALTFFLTILIPGIWPKTWFARFPKTLQRTLGAGGLLSTIKVVVGFVVLALTLVIATIFDMTYHLGAIDRNLFLSILIGILTSLSLYLLGILKFSATTYSTQVTTVRYILALAALSYAIYLVPGLWGSPIRWISSLVPPPYIPV